MGNAEAAGKSPLFLPAGLILIPLSAKDCWPLFSKSYPHWEAILNAHEELHNIQGLELTLAQCQKEFKKVADKISSMVLRRQQGATNKSRALVFTCRR